MGEMASADVERIAAQADRNLLVDLDAERVWRRDVEVQRAQAQPAHVAVVEHPQPPLHGLALARVPPDAHAPPVHGMQRAAWHGM